MDRLIKKIVELIQASVSPSRGIKAVFNGHPQKIPNDSLPAIIVRGAALRSEILDTRRNQEQMQLQIILIDDARNHFNANDTSANVEVAVRKIFEERESTGNELKSDTLMSVIEKELLYLQDYTINVSIDQIRFGTGLDPVFDTSFPGAYYGVMDFTVLAIPHNVNV